ncbi:THAP domain-containing protein 2 isoform X3 [Ooceraea biroi]|nr:THAP domain-containing protein 2 isoform X3 [Ooceraea biroi]
MKVGHLVSYRSAHARRFPLLYVYEYNILTKGCGRTFYRFPLSDKFMLEQWLKQIPMKHWTPNKDSLLCSDHFTENCFDKSAFQVRLKSDSVPTRFGDPQTACIICKQKRSHESMHSFYFLSNIFIFLCM